MTTVPPESPSEQAASAEAPASKAFVGGAGDLEAPGSRVERVDFETQILPVLDRCRPCHFEGGKMYARLPFDDPETLRDLGEALFTRIKDADEQALIRAFLAQR